MGDSLLEFIDQPGVSKSGHWSMELEELDDHLYRVEPLSHIRQLLHCGRCAVWVGKHILQLLEEVLKRWDCSIRSKVSVDPLGGPRSRRPLFHMRQDEQDLLLVIRILGMLERQVQAALR
jgi:hypothetical protein